MPARVRTTITGGFTNPLVSKKYTRASPVDPWVYHSEYTTYSGKQTTKTIEDTTTPGYHSIVECGGFLPINRVMISTKTVEVKPASGTWLTGYNVGPPPYLSVKWDFNEAYAYPDVIGVPAVSSSIMDSLILSAVARLKQSMLDALTTLAELRDLRRLFTSVAFSLRQLIHLVSHRSVAITRSNLRRRRSGRGLRSQDPFQVFAALWLQYRYGWLPLVYAIQDALRALNASIENGQMLVGTASYTETLNDSRTVDTVSTVNEKRTDTTTIQGTRKYSVKAYGKVNNTSRARFAFDPLITAWELVPFSFVVDWFVNVGDFIQAWSPFSGVTPLGVTASTVTDTVTTTTSQWEWFAPFHSGSAGPYVGITEEKVYVRSPVGLPAMPTWNPSLNTVRGIDLASLIYLALQDRSRTLSSIIR